MNLATLLNGLSTTAPPAAELRCSSSPMLLLRLVSDPTRLLPRSQLLKETASDAYTGPTMKENWITLDYLEIFCEKNKSVIRCRRGEDEMWISPLGPHPTTLTSEEVLDILEESSLFEIRRVLEEDPELVESQFLSRVDLEKQIRRMMN